MSARQLSDAHVGSTKSELLAQRSFSSAVIAAIMKPATIWRIAPRHRTCWSHVPWAHTCNRVRSRLLAHRWLYRVADRRYMSLFAVRATFTGTSPGWLLNAFQCIHRYEGAWNANTGNGYYGGLQMDIAFQSLYGGEFLQRWGTADRWPVWAQLEAAARAYNSGRGFYPWPNTARACGLL